MCAAKTGDRPFEREKKHTLYTTSSVALPGIFHVPSPSKGIWLLPGLRVSELVAMVRVIRRGVGVMSRECERKRVCEKERN